MLEDGRQDGHPVISFPTSERRKSDRMARLADKVVLITGAAGAVGGAVAAAVRREGGVAVATDLAGRPGIDHALDVTLESDWQDVLAMVERSQGRLDGDRNGFIAAATEGSKTRSALENSFRDAREAA